jgi:signal transduction histidine kinase
VLPVVRLQAEKFREHYAIATHVTAENDFEVDSRLCEEIIYIVREGLSNIRRHTSASYAAIGLVARQGWLMLRIENDHGGAAPAPFQPRSLAERASALGGSVRVETGATTSVQVRIPL